jgi:hypothetical protein
VIWLGRSSKALFHLLIPTLTKKLGLSTTRILSGLCTGKISKVLFLFFLLLLACTKSELMLVLSALLSADSRSASELSLSLPS